MKKIIAGFLLLLPVCAFGIETGDCAAANQLLALYQVRSLMLRGDSSYEIEKFINKKIDELREPLPGGGFRWVRWVRPPRDPEYDKKGHNVVAVQGSGSDTFEASGDHAYAVRIAVPSKRSLFNANNAVYVGNVHVRYTSNGRDRTKDEAINGWMNPDTTRTIDLETIADHVDVSLESSTASKNVRQSLVEIHLLKAAPQDDPANPNYETLGLLRRVRESSDPDTIDEEIARLEPSESFPVYRLIHQLRRADELIHSKKQEDQEKGDKLLKETLRRLR
ncbi:MAG TPA: hypothetical protein VII12_11615 [Thermoanaerobaculia bacterium]